MAGAENTLVGSAVIKLFGFIKRKGMQVYMKSVLKPKLGRILMNGILRYTVKNDMRGPAIKEWFGIAKIEEETGEEIPFEHLVSFTNGHDIGLNALVIGATVTVKDNVVELEDGLYICNQDNTTFSIKTNMIMSVNDTVTDDTVTDDTVTDDEENNVVISDGDDNKIQQQKIY